MTDKAKEEVQAATEEAATKGSCLICWPAECRCPRIVVGYIAPIETSKINWSALIND